MIINLKNLFKHLSHKIKALNNLNKNQPNNQLDQSQSKKLKSKKLRHQLNQLLLKLQL